MINRLRKGDYKSAFLAACLGATTILAMVGCDSPDLGHQATKEELDTAKQQAATSVESRTDLSPEQKAGLRSYYGGNAPGGPAMAKGAPGAQPAPGK